MIRNFDNEVLGVVKVNCNILKGLVVLDENV